MQLEIETLREKEEYNPSFKNALWILTFYTLLCPIIPTIILLIVSKLIGFSSEDPLAYVATTVATVVLLIMWLKRKYIINIKGMFSLDKTSIIFLLPMTLVIFGSGILLSELDNFIKRVLPMSAYWLETLRTISGEGASPWKGILAIVVTAPIAEEIIFRGILLKGFLKHYSVRKSIILSSLLFGMIHMNPWQFVGAFAGGLILGWWYVKTNSILTPIFGHALNNGLSFILTAIGLIIPGYNTAYSVAIHQPIWFDLLGVILLTLGIVWLITLFNSRQISLERTL